MPRANQADYAGARTRLDFRDLPSLGSGYVVQPKVDGQYVRVTLDHTGRISNVLSRTGGLVSPSLWRDICDPIGEPGSELVGELEAHTEAGERAFATRGYRLIHLFDCLRAGSTYLAREPYRVRRDALCRMHYALDDRPRELSWRGRYRRRNGSRLAPSAPHGPQRTPIVPQASLSRAGELWEQVRAGELEGLVAVALSAPVGARNAKRKVKPTDTLDARVVRAGDRACVVEYGGRTFALSAKGKRVSVGDVVSVRYDGWYERGAQPRFARIERVRADLR